MCTDCQRRAETNPLRVLDCKVPEDQPIIDDLAAHLRIRSTKQSRAHFQQVCDALDACGVPYSTTTGWFAAWTTTRARPSSSRTAAWARRTRCLVAAATTVSSEMLGGPKAPGIGLPSAKTAWC